MSNKILIGDKLFEDKFLPKRYMQTRYPASKSKRIRKKFKKKYTVEIHSTYVFDAKKMNLNVGAPWPLRPLPEVDSLRYLLAGML